MSEQSAAQSKVASAVQTTHDVHVSAPKQRIFLPQSRRERLASAGWAMLRPLVFRFTPGILNPWRIFLLRAFGAVIGRGCFVHQSAKIDFPWNLTLGDNCTIEHGVIINCMGRITLGRRSRISQYAHLCAGTHTYEDATMPIERMPIVIGDDVWIAADAFVGPGVTIGDGALLAARSSAFSNLPPGQVCVGEPAKPRKARFLADARGGSQVECSHQV